MKLKSVTLLLAALGLVGSAAADAKGQRIVFSGCVKQRVIGGALCTFVGRYNISDARPRPNPRRGQGIGGNGVRDPRATICGGLRLSSVRWHYNKMRCPVPRRRG
jgi:hypothetical protein